MPHNFENAKKNRKAWTDALRSGQYKQGYGEYKDAHNCYCVLGLGAKIMGIDGDFHWESVEAWARLPWLTAGDLVAMNDSKKYDFNELALFIERLPYR